jgi:hypothetical protein
MKSFRNTFSSFLHFWNLYELKLGYALVVSARKKGNCYDFAGLILKRLKKTGIETELINFYDYQITPIPKKQK